MERITATDTVFLLDEGGKQYDSVAFSVFIQEQFNRGGKQVFFLVGGPYGFSPEIYARANGKISLSKMTFFAPNDTFVFYRTTVPSVNNFKRRALSS